MKDIATFQALHRFGLGPAQGEAALVGDDPRGWVREQIACREIPPSLRPFKSSADIMATIQSARSQGAQELQRTTRQALRAAYSGEIVARTREMITSERPFAERMVLFWSNHFTVSNAKAIIGPAIPAYEREAIRPHVFGRFADMLKAVVRHPVMLSYLDNAASIGDESRAGRRRRARTGTQTTLNENLAREVLELHTLGVNGGYSQDDVIEFAKTITGWSHGGLRRRNDPRPVHGRFEFQALFHEPGTKTILGKEYKQDGPEQGLAVLDDLARHPATARFIATKLVRHFVADDPPAETVDYMANVFRETDGDLGAVSNALVALDEPWQTPLRKVKSHYEFLIAAHRATDARNVGPREILRPLTELGQVPFGAPSPQGWGDTAADWVAPEALIRRIEWVRRFSASRPVTRPSGVILDDLIGPVATAATRTEVERAPSGDAALALILASPEFQRR